MGTHNRNYSVETILPVFVIWLCCHYYYPVASVLSEAPAANLRSAVKMKSAAA